MVSPECLSILVAHCRSIAHCPFSTVQGGVQVHCPMILKKALPIFCLLFTKFLKYRTLFNRDHSEAYLGTLPFFPTLMHPLLAQ